MIHLEFLLEERSMAVVLNALLPKIIDHNRVSYRLHPHQGKTDLQRSIPKKARVFARIPNCYLVIVRDQDAGDCKQVKNKLVELCRKNHAPPFLIRIACRELESWLLGDMEAVEQAYPKSKATRQARKAKFRNPDNLGNPAQELGKLVKNYGKIARSTAIASYMQVDRNRSYSFQVFVSGLQDFVKTIEVDLD